MTNTSIYNNTIYVAEDQDLPLLLFTDWSRGNPDNTCFVNNIFYVDGKARFTWGKCTNNVFENNAFFGNLDSPPDDPARIIEKPPLVRPGKGTDLASLDAYRPSVEGTMPRGKIVADNGGRDFFGVTPASRITRLASEPPRWFSINSVRRRALRTLSPVLRGEGRVRGQRVAIRRDSQIRAVVPSPQPSSMKTLVLSMIFSSERT